MKKYLTFFILSQKKISRPKISANLKDLILKMLIKDPLKRITIDKIKVNKILYYNSNVIKKKLNLFSPITRNTNG
jgi:serine/threonine protein kinase